MDGLQSSHSSEEAHDFHADIGASWMVRSGLRSSATWPASELRLACYSLPSLAVRRLAAKRTLAYRSGGQHLGRSAPTVGTSVLIAFPRLRLPEILTTPETPTFGRAANQEFGCARGWVSILNSVS
jgi:hypothetical protein